MSNINPVEIACPKCGASFELTESLAAPAIAKAKADSEAAIKEARRQWDAALEAERRAAEKQARELRAQLEEENRTALDAVRKEAAAAAAADAAQRLSAAKDAADGYRQKWADAEKRELDLQREKRDLEDARQRFEREKAEAVNAAIDVARGEAQSAANEASALTIKELTVQLGRARDDAAALKRKLEQKGSQELQGEAAELLLEECLAVAFRTDLIEPVKKGQRGADVLQRVNGAIGAGDGSILWESKNAQNWSNDWPVKARENARDCGAAVVVIVSAVLPKGLKWICHHDSVYLCEPPFAVALAMILRAGIIEVSAARIAVEGRATLAEKLWDYVHGPAFRGRVQGCMEVYNALTDLHNKDKRQTLQRWSAIEKSHMRMLEALCGIRGDLQGLGAQDSAELEEAEPLAIEAAIVDIAEPTGGED
ncbi:MAG TPA: DUF2130 domain-containing protein [Chthonomonadaceae bacterium]|nr:DUF2130 domain-containing protein [Chthonomonadaceae bacterium]